MNATEWRTLAAAIERILPGGPGPGATECNAIGYVEWLTSQEEFVWVASDLRRGVAMLESTAQLSLGRDFADAKPVERDAVLAVIARHSDPTVNRFFAMLVRMTLAGVMCSPRYGGNRDRVAWKYLGYEPVPTDGME